MSEFTWMPPEYLDDDDDADVTDAEWERASDIDFLLSQTMRAIDSLTTSKQVPWLPHRPRRPPMSVEEVVEGLRGFLTVENVLAWQAEERERERKARQQAMDNAVESGDHSRLPPDQYDEYRRLRAERNRQRNVKRYPSGRQALVEQAKREQQGEGLLP